MPAESLTRPAFLILLALSDQPRHGLGVIDEIETRTDGDVRLGPGTLYGTLKRLAESGLVRETDTPPDPEDDDPRRRYYRLTPDGAEALREEAERMRTLVFVAEGKDVLEGSA